MYQIGSKIRSNSGFVVSELVVRSGEQHYTEFQVEKSLPAIFFLSGLANPKSLENSFSFPLFTFSLLNFIGDVRNDLNEFCAK